MFVHALLSTVNTASPLSCFYLEAEGTLCVCVCVCVCSSFKVVDGEDVLH